MLKEVLRTRSRMVPSTLRILMQLNKDYINTEKYAERVIVMYQTQNSNKYSILVVR